MIGYFGKEHVKFDEIPTESAESTRDIHHYSPGTRKDSTGDLSSIAISSRDLFHKTQKERVSRYNFFF
jgi:hypothetical protein